MPTNSSTFIGLFEWTNVGFRTSRVSFLGSDHILTEVETEMGNKLGR